LNDTKSRKAYIYYHTIERNNEEENVPF
jgi:hypothetical protein